MKFKQKNSWLIKDHHEMQEIHRKRHQTKKKNGTYGKSKTEDLRYKYLNEDREIERQPTVNGWSIDFYDKSYDEYEEFRGDYWHGKNRSCEELIRMAEKQEQKTGKRSQYRTIAETKTRDEDKEKWFRENGLVLRIVWEGDFLNEIRELGDNK